MTAVGTIEAKPSRFGQFVERFEALPFVLSVFLGALLIFLVQPMFAKMATPLLGGSPSVWNVSLVCFQAALLFGYVYAHILARLKDIRVQIAIHACLLGVAVICLPLGISPLMGEADPTQPTLWLIGVFMLSIALPFSVVSATAPLIQNWYSATNREDADDPYHLYASSNIGSLIGLGIYPVLVEPFTALKAQTHLWAGGYGVLMILLVVSGAIAVRARLTSGASVVEAHSGEKSPLSWRERGYWLLLAFVPSSLLVGATTYISADVAAAPFLWAPPLMVYILSFIIVFSKSPAITLETSRRLLPVAVALTALFMAKIADFGWPVTFGVTLLSLFLSAMVCHGLMAERRPPVDRLTEFYLIMSLGGVLGGAMNALVAPVIFSTIFEYPLMLGAVLLIACNGPTLTNRLGRIGLIVAGFVAAFCAASLLLPGKINIDAIRLLDVFAFAVLAAMGNRRWAVGALFGAMYLASLAYNPHFNAQAERSFFGIVRVKDDTENGFRFMMHGTTLHGAQRLSEEGRLDPLGYYAAETAVGQPFALYPEAEEIGIVGLGAGALACHATEGQKWTYFEIDPLVIKLATDPNVFSYLSECTPDGQVVLGDARIKLEQMSGQQFDILVLDAFSSNAIPMHLVTREALNIYMDRVSDEGVFVAHISNRSVSLEKVFARLVAAEGYHMLYQFSVPKSDEKTMAVSATVAVMIAKDPAVLERAKATGLWTEVPSDGGKLWTDDYSNIVGAMIDKAFSDRN